MPVAEANRESESRVGNGDSVGEVTLRSDAESLLDRESKVQLACLARGFVAKNPRQVARKSWMASRAGPWKKSSRTMVSTSLQSSPPSKRRSATSRRPRCGERKLAECLSSFASSTTALITHWAYLRIIGMGVPVLPYLLAELRANPNYWFWALEAISGRDPADQDDAFDTRVAKWLRWGQSAGLIRGGD